MEFKESNSSIKLEVGDIVVYENNYCIVVEEFSFVDKRHSEQRISKYPYLLIGLSTGMVVNAFESLEKMAGDGVEIRARNKNTVLTYNRCIG